MTQTSNMNSKKKILAVDDAAITLSRIVEVLQNDYEVVTANSGARALKYLEKQKPDLILLDIKMSPMDGLKTLKEIRTIENLADIPVIMLTGMEDKKSVLDCAKLGICDYVLKPFAEEALLSRIRRVFESES